VGSGGWGSLGWGAGEWGEALNCYLDLGLGWVRLWGGEGWVMCRQPADDRPDGWSLYS
jgi:hypothetical protein